MEGLFGPGGVLSSDQQGQLLCLSLPAPALRDEERLSSRPPSLGTCQVSLGRLAQQASWCLFVCPGNSVPTVSLVGLPFPKTDVNVLKSVFAVK